MNFIKVEIIILRCREMIQLLAGSSFFILLCVGFAQRPPIDTSAPIVRISPPLKNNGSNDADFSGPAEPGGQGGQLPPHFFGR